MTDQSNLFNQEKPEDLQQKPQPSNNLFENQLKVIVNEDGSQKYDSVEKALEGSKHAQEYIQQLKSGNSSKEAEISSLKAELEKRDSLDEVVAKLATNQQPEETSPPAGSQGLSEEAVATLIKSTLQQKDETSLRVTNEEKVNTSLLTAYGEKAPEVLKAKASQLGVSIADLKEMAQTKPDVVLALFTEKTAGGISPSTSSINLPPNSNAPEGLAPPDKSLMFGASSKEVNEYFKKVKADVYSQHAIET